MNSSSTVSMRWRVSGPLSVQRCLPTRPKRGSSVASSVAVATHLRTPRGPNFALNAGSLRIVLLFGVLFGVEVVQVAEEFVEAVHRRQVLVAIAEVILAELSGGVALSLQHLGKRGRDGLQAQLAAGGTDGGQAAAYRVLAGDERRAARRARWLRIVVAEHHAFTTDAVDVGRAVAHHSGVVEADVGVADVVAEDHEDVGMRRSRDGGAAHESARQGQQPKRAEGQRTDAENRAAHYCDSPSAPNRSNGAGHRGEEYEFTPRPKAQFRSSRDQPAYHHTLVVDCVADIARAGLIRQADQRMPMFCAGTMSCAPYHPSSAHTDALSSARPREECS